MAQAPQTLQVANNEKIYCECQEASVLIGNDTCEGDDIYYCKFCPGKRYCDDCGAFYHRKKKGKFVLGHGFDSKNIKSLKKFLTKDEDKDNTSRGKQILMAIVGYEQFNKYLPLVNNVAGIGSAGVGGIMLAVEFSQFIKSGADLATFATKNVINGCGIATVALSVIEIGIHAIRWYKGDISGKEWLRLTGRTVVKNTAAFGGVAIGAKLGAMAGSAIAPGVGTAVGTIAGIILGLAGGYAGGQTFDAIFPNGEKEAKKQEMLEALTYFHFQVKDLNNDNLFNKKEVQKRFKLYALDAHPDRHNGDYAEWYILSQHYGTLLAYCDSNKNDKKLVQNVVSTTPQAITH